ncbi:MAG: chorismate mutase [Chloroflexi bacterium]|nr:chorismate mutase [Chloroflexota bacterium]MDA1173987.1 chorismate mutase [Chloroflexota bacterium]
MTQCLGLRGATTADANTKAAIVDATKDLLEELVAANGIAENDVGAVFFTTTADLNAEFPPVALRVHMGWEQTALLTSPEIRVPGAHERVIRVMLLVNTERSKEELVHVYLKGAKNLRARGTQPG